MITETKPSCYYWYGEFGIISDAPGAVEAIKEHPELPVKTLKEWEAMFSDRVQKESIESIPGFSISILTSRNDHD